MKTKMPDPVRGPAPTTKQDLSIFKCPLCKGDVGVNGYTNPDGDGMTWFAFCKTPACEWDDMASD